MGGIVRCANGLAAELKLMFEGFVRLVSRAVSDTPLQATNKGAPVAAPP